MISATLIDIRVLRGEANSAVVEAMRLNNALDQIQWLADYALKVTAPKDLVQEGIKLYHEERS